MAALSTLHYITLHYCTGTPDTMNVRNIHVPAVVLPGNTAAAYLSSLENWALSLQTFQARRKAIAFFRRKRHFFFKALVVVMWQTHVDTIYVYIYIYLILYVCKSNHQLIGNPFTVSGETGDGLVYLVPLAINVKQCHFEGIHLVRRRKGCGQDLKCHTLEADDFCHSIAISPWSSSQGGWRLPSGRKDLATESY